MLTIFAVGGVESMMNCVAMSVPSRVFVSALTTRSIVAPGATLAARVTSSVASAWFFTASLGLSQVLVVPVVLHVVAAGPGSTPLGGTITVGCANVTPASCMKLVRSAAATRDLPTIAMVWPLPSMCFAYSALMS